MSLFTHVKQVHFAVVTGLVDIYKKEQWHTYKLHETVLLLIDNREKPCSKFIANQYPKFRKTASEWINVAPVA